MFPHHRPCPAHAPVKVHVLVADVADVQRILVLLTGRNYPITRFEAEDAGSGRWRLSIDCVVDAQGADLLEARLHRLPGVLTVRLRPSEHLAATG
jgi:hypothetical protein